MATKVGGLFISLALDYREFDNGMDSAAKKVKDADKMQNDLAKGYDRSETAARRLGGQMMMFAGAGNRYVSLIVGMYRAIDVYTRAAEKAIPGTTGLANALLKLDAAGKAIATTLRSVGPMLLLNLVITAFTTYRAFFKERREEEERYRQQLIDTQTALLRGARLAKVAAAKSITEQIKNDIQEMSRITELERSEALDRARKDWEEFEEDINKMNKARAEELKALATANNSSWQQARDFVGGIAEEMKQAEQAGRRLAGLITQKGQGVWSAMTNAGAGRGEQMPTAEAAYNRLLDLGPTNTTLEQIRVAIVEQSHQEHAL